MLNLAAWRFMDCLLDNANGLTHFVPRFRDVAKAPTSGFAAIAASSMLLHFHVYHVWDLGFGHWIG